jgi:sulfite exporter TauE/SafE
MRLKQVGERVLSFAAYLVFGVVAGAIGTVGHRARLELWGFDLWLGIVVALLGVLLVAVGLRMYLEERAWVLAYAIGVVAAVFALSMPGAEHSVLVPASASGFGVGEIWTFGSAIAAFLPVIWPDVRGAKREAAARKG